MKSVFCAFCGKHEDQVDTIVSGQIPEAYICDSCVERAHDFITQEKALQSNEDGLDIRKIRKEEVTPDVLKSHLDQYVIGQESAKKALCVAVYNHYKRLAAPPSEDGVEIEKSNVFLVGPTGVGKTLLASTIAKRLKVPFCSVSMTQMTQAGYVGDDVESALSALLQAADGNVKAAQMGIVYMDEADKMARKGDNPSLTRDVGGEGLQQALLKLIEGGIVNVPPQGGRKHPDQKTIPIDTTHILFILGGAFEGIEKIIERRLHMRPLGFDLKGKKSSLPLKEDIGGYVSAQDLKAYGFIPELVGRIPVITHLNPLDQKALYQVLTEPKNALIKQYKKLMAMEEIELSFTEKALHYMVEKALELKVGARGLRSICETVMQDAMFHLPSQSDVKRYEIDQDYAQRKLEGANIGKLKVG